MHNYSQQYSNIQQRHWNSCVNITRTLWAIQRRRTWKKKSSCLTSVHTKSISDEWRNEFVPWPPCEWLVGCLSDWLAVWWLVGHECSGRLWMNERPNKIKAVKRARIFSSAACLEILLTRWQSTISSHWRALVLSSSPEMSGLCKTGNGTSYLQTGMLGCHCGPGTENAIQNPNITESTQGWFLGRQHGLSVEVILLWKQWQPTESTNV